MRRTVVVLATIAVAIVVAPTAAAGGGCHWETSKWTAQRSDADEVTAHIAGCRYESTTLHVQPGTTVTWLNKDPVPHSVTGPFLSIGSDKLLNRGDAPSFSFQKEGVYPYYCVLHPGMAASVVVGDASLAVSGTVASSGTVERASGTYDAAAPIEGSSTEGGTDASIVPMAAGIAAIAGVGIATATFMVRRRRRAVPVPGALP